MEGIITQLIGIESDEEKCDFIDEQIVRRDEENDYIMDILKEEVDENDKVETITNVFNAKLERIRTTIIGYTLKTCQGKFETEDICAFTKEYEEEFIANWTSANGFDILLDETKPKHEKLAVINTNFDREIILEWIREYQTKEMDTANEL